jgi:peptidoglycan/xylan/chitin deacetylase (PgdA/CDA1 family)
MLAREVAELATRPRHMIGAHGVHHLLLPAQTLDVRVRETAQSKARLEALLGRPVLAFAYPYGGFDAVTVEVVRAAGFRVAVTTTESLLLPCADPMRLPRHEIRARDSRRFAAVLREAARATP